MLSFTNEQQLFSEVVEKLAEGFEHLPNYQGNDSEDELIKSKQALIALAEKLQDNYPYHHPLYVGQMLKPPHPVARLAYALAMHINPNNHALDGGRATSALEKEIIQVFAAFFEMPNALGHLTSGGTMANLEALWVAGNCHPNQEIVASTQSHYTHSRITAVLQLPFATIACTQEGVMDFEVLEQKLKQGNVGTVVVTLGTTGMGMLDPLDKVLELKEIYGFRIHVDAAYGGFFGLLRGFSTKIDQLFALLSQVDSLVIDPHKHGLQPYGCGMVLFKDPSVGKFYLHDSPYTYFSSDELHLGEISLECSRPGAAAAALWATLQVMPLVTGGTFAKGLANSLQAAQKWYQWVSEHSDFIPINKPDLDIVVFACKGQSIEEMSRKAQALFKACADQHMHLALYKMPIALLPALEVGITENDKFLTCIRMCFMKPEHLDWLEKMQSIITESLSKIT